MRQLVLIEETPKYEFVSVQVNPYWGVMKLEAIRETKKDEISLVKTVKIDSIVK